MKSGLSADVRYRPVNVARDYNRSCIYAVFYRILIFRRFNISGGEAYFAPVLLALLNDARNKIIRAYNGIRAFNVTDA